MSETIRARGTGDGEGGLFLFIGAFWNVRFVISVLGVCCCCSGSTDSSNHEEGEEEEEVWGGDTVTDVTFTPTSR